MFGGMPNIILALISSAKSKEFKLPKTLVVGEVGLTGEIRPVPTAERLVKEAEKLGFENVIIPFRNKDKIKSSSINVIGVSNLKEAITKIF